MKRARDIKYKDKKRHGGMRAILLKEQEVVFYRCSKCGLLGDSYQIVAHHSSFNPNDHENQVLLCRSCHAKTHNCIASLNYKDVTKEQIEAAFEKHNFLDDVCDELGISRATLYQKRKQFGLDNRTHLRGRKRKLTG